MYITIMMMMMMMIRCIFLVPALSFLKEVEHDETVWCGEKDVGFNKVEVLPTSL